MKKKWPAPQNELCIKYVSDSKVHANKQHCVTKHALDEAGKRWRVERCAGSRGSK